MNYIGKINKLFKFIHPSHTYAAVQVVSFWSVRKSDCRYAASSSTAVDFAEVANDLQFAEAAEIGLWFDIPLKIGEQSYSSQRPVARNYGA